MQLMLAIVFGLLLAGVCMVQARNQSEGSSGGMLLSHDVFFTLEDNSPEAKKKLVEACKKYLTNHPGEVFFVAGTRVEELTRPVNDQDYEVALHIVFTTREDHDRYQDAPRHKQFIDENKDNWKKVRVFDSHVER